MRFRNLASSSSGNSTYAGSGSTHLLIDAGISRKRIISGLDEAQLGLRDISAILITHEHSDHISSLGVLERTVPVPVYATEGTIRAILADKSLGDFDRDVFHVIKSGCPFTVGDILIKPLAVSHDANEPVCFRLESGGRSCAVVTDLGVYDEALCESLKGLDIIMMEANHDTRMLEAGRYPYYLKRRIAGKYGHLSNEAGGRFLSELLHDGIKEIILGHLSRENNYPALARLAVEAEISTAPNKYKGNDFNIRVAKPDEPLEIMEV